MFEQRSINKKKNLVGHLISSIQHNPILNTTVKYAAYGMLLYYQPQLIVVPVCNEIIKRL